MQCWKYPYQISDKFMIQYMIATLYSKDIYILQWYQHLQTYHYSEDYNKKAPVKNNQNQVVSTVTVKL